MVFLKLVGTVFLATIGLLGLVIGLYVRRRMG